MVRYLSFFLSLTLLVSVSFAKTNESLVHQETLSSQGVGEGKSRSEAVKNALLEALSKIDGLNVSEKSYSSSLKVEDFDGKVSKIQYNGTIEELSSGKVDSYEVVSVKKTGTLYTAKVKVKKIKKSYKTPDADEKLRRIVVYPAYKNSSFELFSSSVSSKDVTQKLDQDVLNAISSSKKLIVLDRQMGSAYLAEKFIIQTQGSEDEMLKLGKVLGSDYIYVFFIEDFVMKKDSQKDSLTGVSSAEIQGEARVQYRLMVSSTRQIKRAGSKSFRFKAKDMDAKQSLSKFLQDIGKSLGEDLLKIIYNDKAKIEIQEDFGFKDVALQRADVSEEEKPSEVKQNEGGGVILPFD